MGEKSRRGNGGNFKKTTWKAAEVFMAELFTGEGGPKTANSLRGNTPGGSPRPEASPTAAGFNFDDHQLLPSARGMNVFRPSQSQPEAPNDAAAAGASQDVDGVSQEALEQPISNWARQPTPPPDQPVSPQAPLVLPFTPAPLKQKESALSVSLTHGQKQPRLSGAVSLHGIAAAFADFNKTFRVSMSGTRPGVESTPTRKKMAMEKLMLNEKHLTEDESLCLIDLFQDNVSAADTYLTIEVNEPLHKKWVVKCPDN
ncbi:hypothetical protein FPV67DRAFT_1672996 [Lyophyllum atratum]|nr:hypothetical protein FPV67DRAFT_1672996 [Lyophyllum atratum]